MEKIKILAIGNSFSENTTFFVHQAAKAAGIEVKVVNLNIGGCSFRQHWENIESDAHEYRREVNGVYDEAFTSNLREILLSDSWDHIVTQQASRDSGVIESYYPYTEKVISYLKDSVPAAKIWLQQTWAYEVDSTNGFFSCYHHSQSEMYEKLTKCYSQVAEELHLPLIPTGRIIQQLRKLRPFDYQKGGLSLCCDGHHLSAVYGKYAAALVWVKYLLNGDIETINFVPKNRFTPKVDVQTEYLDLIKKLIAAEA